MTKRILIVDDDEDDRELFCDTVAKIDSTIDCFQAKDGEEALTFLKKLTKTNLPDFIFLDLNMPRINGKQCLIELKKSKPLSEIPVIIYTSSKWDKDKMETRMLGAAHFITKPRLLADLYKAISFVLEERWVTAVHSSRP
jgi:DNA-binding response OmpR family regulator